MRTRPMLLAALLAAACIPVGRAQVMADRVPANAIAYAGWAGSEALESAYDASHLKGIMDALQLPTFLETQIRTAMEREPNAQRAENTRLLQDLLTAMAKSPTAMYIGKPVNAADNPEFAIVSKVGKDAAEALAPRLQAVITRTRRGGGPTIGTTVSGDLLYVHAGSTALPERLASLAAEESLATRETFKNAVRQLDMDTAKAVAMLYLDGEMLAGYLSDAVELSRNDQLRGFYPPIAEGAGLNSLKQAVWAGGFDGADWQSRTFVGMGPQRNGLLALLDNPPLEQAAMRLIPRTATAAGVMRFDGTRLLNDVMETAAQVNDRAPAQIDTALTQAWAWTGIDIKRDLLPALGDEFIYYGAPDAAGNSLRGFTLINRLRDPAKAQAALLATENFVNLLILQRDPNSKMQFQTQALPAPLQSVQAHVIALEGFSPAWAIDGANLYLSLSLPALQSAIEMGRNPRESLLENPQFVALRGRLGLQEFASFSFADLQNSAPETFELISRSLAQALRQAPNAAGAFTLPPLNRITPHLGPVLQLYWTDTRGFHGRGISPFPLAGQLSPTQMIWLQLGTLGQQRRPTVPPARGVQGGLP